MDETYFRSRSPELVLVRSETPVADPPPAQFRRGRPSGRCCSRSSMEGDTGITRPSTNRELGRYLLIFRREDVVFLMSVASEAPAAVAGGAAGVPPGASGPAESGLHLVVVVQNRVSRNRESSITTGYLMCHRTRGQAREAEASQDVGESGQVQARAAARLR